MILKIESVNGAATTDWIIVDLQGTVVRPSGAGAASSSLDGCLIGKLAMKPVRRFLRRLLTSECVPAASEQQPSSY